MNPHLPIENKKGGIGVSIEKFWESLRIPNRVDGIYYSLEASL